MYSFKRKQTRVKTSFLIRMYKYFLIGRIEDLVKYRVIQFSNSAQNIVNPGRTWREDEHKENKDDQASSWDQVVNAAIAPAHVIPHQHSHSNVYAY